MPSPPPDPDINLLEEPKFSYVPPITYEQSTISRIIGVVQPLLDIALENFPTTSIIDCRPHKQNTLYQYFCRVIRNVRLNQWRNIPELTKTVKLLDKVGADLIIRKLDLDKLQVCPKFSQTADTIQIGGNVPDNSLMRLKSNKLPFTAELFNAFLFIKEQGIAQGEVHFEGANLADLEHLNDNYHGEPLVNAIICSKEPNCVSIIS